jgi:hypothetical protein
MKMNKITTYSLLGGMGVITLSAIMVSSAGASQRGPQVDLPVSEKPMMMKRWDVPNESPLLELFGLNQEEYLDLLRDDISLREYAETENLRLDQITAEAQSQMIDRLDKDLEAGKITQDEYDEKVGGFSEHLEARLDAEDLEDLPEHEMRERERQERSRDEKQTGRDPRHRFREAK